MNSIDICTQKLASDLYPIHKKKDEKTGEKKCTKEPNKDELIAPLVHVKVYEDDLTMCEVRTHVYLSNDIKKEQIAVVLDVDVKEVYAKGIKNKGCLFIIKPNTPAPEAPPYSLWEIVFDWPNNSDIPLFEVKITYDEGAKTSRGTVTSPKDPGDYTKK